MSDNNLPPGPPESQADSAHGIKRSSSKPIKCNRSLANPADPPPPAGHGQDSLREQLQHLQCSYDDSQRQVAQLQAQVASLQLDKQQTQKAHDLTLLKLRDAAEEARKSVERQSSAFQAIEAQGDTVPEPTRDAEAAAKAEGPAIAKALDDKETAEAGRHTAPKAASDAEGKTVVRAESSRSAEANTSSAEQPWPTPPAMSLTERIKQLSESSANILARAKRLETTQVQSRDLAREMEKKWLPVLEAERSKVLEEQRRRDQEFEDMNADFAETLQFHRQNIAKIKARQAKRQAQSGKGKAKASEETQVEHTSAPHAAASARPGIEEESQRPSKSAPTQDVEMHNEPTLQEFQQIAKDAHWGD